MKFWGSSVKVKVISGSPVRGLQKWPFLQLPGDGPCSMNTQNTSLSFSDVFKIFIGLRAKAVAVSKSDYTMYSMRPKLSSNLREFRQCIFDVARPSLPQKLYSSRTNLIERQRHHMKRAPAERTAFRFVFMKCDRKNSGKVACFWSAQKRSCGRYCASLITPKIVFKPYKLDRTSTASYEMSARRENSFSFRIYEMRSKK